MGTFALDEDKKPRRGEFLTKAHLQKDAGFFVISDAQRRVGIDVDLMFGVLKPPCFRSRRSYEFHVLRFIRSYEFHGFLAIPIEALLFSRTHPKGINGNQRQFFVMPRWGATPRDEREDPESQRGLDGLFIWGFIHGNLEGQQFTLW